MPQTQIDQSDARSFYGCFQEVRLLTSTAIALSGLQTLQGVVLAAGERVCVSGQASAIENGIYLVSATAWERSVDCESGDEVGGMILVVGAGDMINEVWKCSNAVGGGIVGTDVLTFVPFLLGTPDGNFRETILVFNVNGTLSSGNRFDGARSAVATGVIVGVAIAMSQRGSDGDTIIDIFKHSILNPPLVEGQSQFGLAGTSIYSTTPANRPTVAGDNVNKFDNAIHRAYNPDDLGFVRGDFFTMNIVQNTSSSKDLTVLISVRYD